MLEVDKVIATINRLTLLAHPVCWWCVELAWHLNILLCRGQY